MVGTSYDDAEQIYKCPHDTEDNLTTLPEDHQPPARKAYSVPIGNIDLDNTGNNLLMTQKFR